MELSQTDLMRLAKRISNPKRSYLIVNPLQGKHVPVDPRIPLELMRRLSARVRERCSDIGVVIGFAETATALAAGTAADLPAQWLVQTTRERGRKEPDGGRWIRFTEDHSHAADQALFVGNGLRESLREKPVLVLDDEISTGRTCVHLVEALRQNITDLNARILLASIICRMTDEDRRRAEDTGIETVSLLDLEPDDLSKTVEGTCAYEAEPPEEAKVQIPLYIDMERLPDPRFGVRTTSYEKAVASFCEHAGSHVLSHLDREKRVLVLGTEELMYPAIQLGVYLKSHYAVQVLTHATTRSPIGICNKDDYPLHNGVRLKSLYDANRTTYLYNLSNYGTIIVVTDAHGSSRAGIRDLQKAFAKYGAERFIVLRV